MNHENKNTVLPYFQFIEAVPVTLEWNRVLNEVRRRMPEFGVAALTEDTTVDSYAATAYDAVGLLARCDLTRTTPACFFPYRKPN